MLKITVNQYIDCLPYFLVQLLTKAHNGLSTSWGQCRVSVDATEAATGLDVLSAGSTAAQQAVEVRVDTGPTS